MSMGMKNGKWYRYLLWPLPHLYIRLYRYFKRSRTSLNNQENLKTSFREVLRLARGGQQSWWTEAYKESTSDHIAQVEKYYNKTFK